MTDRDELHPVLFEMFLAFMAICLGIALAVEPLQDGSWLCRELGIY